MLAKISDFCLLHYMQLKSSKPDTFSTPKLYQTTFGSLLHGCIPNTEPKLVQFVFSNLVHFGSSVMEIMKTMWKRKCRTMSSFTDDDDRWRRKNKEAAFRISFSFALSINSHCILLLLLTTLPSSSLALIKWKWEEHIDRERVRQISRNCQNSSRKSRFFSHELSASSKLSLLLPLMTKKLVSGP